MTLTEAERMVDAILQVKFPALFREGWRSLDVGPNNQQWNDDMVAHAEQIIAALEPFVAARVAEAQAKALEDAATWIRFGLDTSNSIGKGAEMACRELDARAAALRPSEGSDRG